MQTLRPRFRGPVPTVSIIAILLVAVTMVSTLWRHPIRQLPPTPNTLARLRANTPAGMVLVPGGDCLLGSDDSDADDEVKPRHRAFVSSFYIDTHEVTNAAYKKFDSAHTFLSGDDDLPATNITYAQAEAYAKWAGKRLPTDEEWEKAARGTDGRRYPWGDRWDPGLVAPRARRKSDAPKALEPRTLGKSRFISCNLGPPRVQRVGSVAGGISPYGCYDMAGNAWEWVQGFYNGNPDQRILRGGAVGYSERACRTYIRAVEGAGST
jgi:formylglycine-generating enzyme required for sulfatase activity